MLLANLRINFIRPLRGLFIYGISDGCDKVAKLTFFLSNSILFGKAGRRKMNLENVSWQHKASEGRSGLSQNDLAEEAGIYVICS